MKNKTSSPLFRTQAILWDGTRQLLGSLELWENELLFHPTDFKDTHLSLSIPLTTISKVEEYLVFDIAKNGLRIDDKDGKNDLFVIDDVRTFKNMLIELLTKI